MSAPASELSSAAIVINPASGRGRAVPVADRLQAALHAAGIATSRWHVDALEAQLASNPAPRAVLIVGGDGSVHHALPALQRAAVPFWHVPTGTENLIARELNHSARPDAVLRALRAGRSRPIDLIRVTPASPDHTSALAAVMLSVGPDAGVIARLDASRTGPITHASYLRPSILEAFAPSLAPISLWADGVEVINARPGWLVIANMRSFGARVNPCADARHADGLLDAMFVPATSAARVLAAMALLRLRLPVPGAIRRRAREFTLARGSCPVQADGEVFARPWSLLTLRAVGGLRAIEAA
jgi:diacylglycerol kinase (ATP)